MGLSSSTANRLLIVKNPAQPRRRVHILIDPRGTVPLQSSAKTVTRICDGRDLMLETTPQVPGVSTWLRLPLTEEWFGGVA